MASNEFEDQPAQMIEDERAEEPLEHARAKYGKGDMVHMATIANGQRVKGVFTVQAAIYNQRGWVEYQLKDTLTGQLHRHGAGVREKELKPGA
ncbi:hypothetical protein EKO04_000600 [Ascochyta lentis]|uniref:Uncharacterized protein n=1 Tax=Ascochyta lentis TaxID=205686 RepID=A0A8H7JEN7_9PLEO|nr:hypothetical protein EKO04_000600 [Ascochyta lentis]